MNRKRVFQNIILASGLSFLFLLPGASVASGYLSNHSYQGYNPHYAPTKRNYGMSNPYSSRGFNRHSYRSNNYTYHQGFQQGYWQGMKDARHHDRHRAHRGDNGHGSNHHFDQRGGRGNHYGSGQYRPYGQSSSGISIRW